MKLVVGTHNTHKIAELSRILGPLLPGVDLLAAVGDPPVEDGPTFYANALIKARAAHNDSGLPAIADDSGIEVGALGGAPGVLSARYSPSGKDEDNTALLITTMKGVADRRAAFVCAAAYVFEGEEFVIERRWEGTLALRPQGAGGFGYDPVFIPEGHQRSAAEFSPDEKDQLSHRGKAFRALAPLIAQRL